MKSKAFDHSKYALWIDPAKVVPYERNAKIHTEKQVDNIVNSLNRFGWQQDTVLTTDNVLVIGHGRRLAALKIGCEMPYHVIDKAADELTDEDIRELRIADNQTNAETGLDLSLLESELEGLEFDGFDFDFGIEIDDDEPELEVVEDDYDAQPPAEPKTKRGDMYQLGRHRLMCGDATSTDDVRDLMGGHRADVCFTSPPYNMGASMGGGWESAPNRAMHAGNAYSACSDDLDDDNYADLLIRSVTNAIEYADDVMFNVGLLSKSRIGVIRMLAAHEKEFGDIVVWNKSNSMPFGMKSQRGLLGHRCEMIFCFNRRGTRSFSHPQWEKGCGINRIDTKNAANNRFADIHAATFPIEFAAAVIKNFTEQSVLDLFGGTGTTMIAAEQLGRNCYMMELDPGYCDVIIDRWEKITGEKAVLIQ